MTTLSPEERTDELKWIARLVFGVGLVMGLCGRDDLGLVAFVVAFVVAHPGRQRLAAFPSQAKLDELRPDRPPCACFRHVAYFSQ